MDCYNKPSINVDCQVQINGLCAKSRPPDWALDASTVHSWPICVLLGCPEQTLGWACLSCCPAHLDLVDQPTGCTSYTSRSVFYFFYANDLRRCPYFRFICYSCVMWMIWIIIRVLTMLMTNNMNKTAGSLSFDCFVVCKRKSFPFGHVEVKTLGFEVWIFFSFL